MTVIRATKKVLKFLPSIERTEGGCGNALGDWYVNRIVIDRKPLLLMLSEKSRLAILEPARDLKSLPTRLPEIVRRRLSELSVPHSQIMEEIRSMIPIAVGPTESRSIVGQMVDFAKSTPYYLPEDSWTDADLRVAEDKMGGTPCLCSGKSSDTIWPIKETRRLLAEKWLQ